VVVVIGITKSNVGVWAFVRINPIYWATIPVNEIFGSTNLHAARDDIADSLLEVHRKVEAGRESARSCLIAHQGAGIGGREI